MGARRAVLASLGVGAAIAATALAYLALRVPRPGAGAAYQEAPDQAVAGATAELTLRLATWGAGGPAQGRYADVRLQSRESAAQEWSETSPRRVSVGPDSGQTYHFELTIPNTPATTISYRFTFVFDGQTHTVVGIKQIQITPAPLLPPLPR